MGKSPSSNDQSGKSNLTNTDSSLVQDYSEEPFRRKVPKLRLLLHEAEEADLGRFIEKICFPVSAYHAQSHGHKSIPIAKDQKRFLKKLSTCKDRVLKYAIELDELLESSPYDLRREAREAKSSISVIRSDLTRLTRAINDLTPSKSKFRPEIKILINDVIMAYRSELGCNPEIRAFNESTHPQNLSLAETFVPLLSEVLNISLDAAYREARKNCPLESHATTGGDD